MIDTEKLHNELRKKCSFVGAAKKISEMRDINRFYISRLLNGRVPLDGLSIRKFNQLFPNATLVFEEDEDIEKIASNGSRRIKRSCYKKGGTAKKVRISAYIPRELNDALVRSSRILGTSKSQLIQSILTEYEHGNEKKGNER